MLLFWGPNVLLLTLNINVILLFMFIFIENRPCCAEFFDRGRSK